MYRRIKNMLKGRKKVHDKSIEYADGWKIFYPIISRLHDLGADVNVILRDTNTWEHKTSFSYETHNGSPQEIAKYLEDRLFKDDLWYYYSGRWQDFSGKHDVRHYIDIKVNSKRSDSLSDLFEPRPGQIVRKMSIEYLVMKR